MNVWSFIGSVGKKGAEVRQANGKPMLSFSVASESGYGAKKVTTWVGCTMFGDRGAKLAEYIKAGDKIAVTGEHGTREFEGNIYTTCNVQNITLLGNNRQDSSSARPAQSQQSSGSFDDPIPF